MTDPQKIKVCGLPAGGCRKEKMSFISVLFFVCCFALFGSFSPASAYIDPATTSYVLELVVGAVVVGGAALGYYWRKIKNKVNKNEEKSSGVSVEEQLSGLDDDDED